VVFNAELLCVYSVSSWETTSDLLPFPGCPLWDRLFVSRCAFVLFQLSGREANAMGRKFIVFQHCGSEIYKSAIENTPIVFRSLE